MKYIVLLILIISIPGMVAANELKPFTTDGCSAFPDGSLEHQSLWVNCCIQHDLAYWKGGTYEQRLSADNALKACVDQVGEPKIASLMLAGVRVGGTPYLPTSFRWGYGWPYPRGYKVITEEEKKEIKAQLQVFKIMIQSIYEGLE